MQKLCVILAAGLVVTGVGCRSADSNASLSHSERESIANLKSNLRHYKHVLLIRICGDHWEDRGPHEYSLHRFEASVVRVYKGNWSVSERIAFVHGVDAPARAAANTEVGALMFLFTNEHTTAEIGVDAGEFFRHDSAGERRMLFIFPNRTASK